MNANHHHNWGDSNHNYNGFLLNRSINVTDLDILTNFKLTRLSPPESFQSVIFPLKFQCI